MGLAWNDDAPYTNEDTLNRSLDPYRYVLSLPVVEPAGSVWNYSGGAASLIGGILSRATGKRFDVRRHSAVRSLGCLRCRVDMAPDQFRE